MNTHRSLAFIVHGIGEQPKGSTLKLVGENFLPLVRRRLDAKAVVRAKPLDDEGPADVLFSFQADTSDQEYEVRFAEVWWAKSFSPPGFGTLLQAGVVAFWHRWIRQGTKAKWYTYPFRLLGEAAYTLFFNAIAIAIAILLLPLTFLVSLYAVLPKKPIWTPRPGTRRAAFADWVERNAVAVQGVLGLCVLAAAGILVFRGTLEALLVLLVGPISIVFVLYVLFPSKRLWNPTTISFHEALLGRVGKLHTMIVETAVIFLAIPLGILALLLWLIEAVVPKAALSSPVKDIHLAIINLLTGSFGDMTTYLYQPWEASRVRSRFEQSFVDGVTAALDEHPNIEQVMIIAHSMGSVVVYEALTGDSLRPFLVQRFGGGSSVTLTFVSVGSALNLAWDAASSSERHRFERKLPSQVSWLNIWSEYDPVGGEPLRLPTSAFVSRPPVTADSQGLSVPLQQRGVVNQMDLFSDHTSYWNNAEEVIAPLLDGLTNGAFSSRLRMKILERRTRVRVLAGFKSVAWLLGMTAFVAAIGFPERLEDGGRWLVEQAWKVLPEVVTKNLDSAWEFLTSVFSSALLIALIVTALVVVVYSTLVKWLWDFWDQRRKYDMPSLLEEAANLENLRRAVVPRAPLPIVPSSPLHNHGRNERWQPGVGFRPRGIDELRDVMSYLKEARVAMVKAGGSRHSWSPAAVSSGVYIHPEGMSSIDRVLDIREESFVLREDLDGLGKGLCLIGSGTEIRRINDALWEDGRALPVLGGFDGQTIAGVVQTATHGSVPWLGPIANVVRSINLVDAVGRPFRVEREDGPTDAARFAEAFPEWILHKEGAVFEAALVSAGMFGVVHSYIVESVPAFHLREIRTRISLTEMRKVLRDGGIRHFINGPNPADSGAKPLFEGHPASPYHIEFLVNPHPVGGDHTVMVTSRDILKLEGEEPEAFRRTRSDADNLFRVLTQSSKFSRPAFSTWLSEHVPWLLARIPEFISKRWPATTPILLDVAMTTIHDEAFEGRSYNVFNIGDGQNGIPALSSEPSVPLRNDMYLDALDVILDRAAYFAKKGRYHTGPISMRFVSASEAMLADNEPVCRFEIIFTGGTGHAVELMRDYEDALFRHFGGNVRPHWGQINNLNKHTRSRLSEMYPRLTEWLRLRQGFDPEAILLNDWQRELFL